MAELVDDEEYFLRQLRINSVVMRVRVPLSSLKPQYP